MLDASHATTPAGRVAILTSVHPWNDPRIFLKQATSLAAAGLDVTLVAEREADADLGGVKIHAIPFTRTRLERMLLSPMRILARANNMRIFHFHDPELIPAGLMLKLAGKRVIYDVHEDLPRAIEYKHWIPAPLRWLVARAAELTEHLAALLFDRIIAATPIIGARFPAAKTVIVQNFPILSELTVAEPAPYTTRPNTFIYVGNIAPMRGAIQMVDAIGHAKNATAEFILIGNCSPASLLDDMKARPGWQRTRYLGYKGRKEIGELLATARAGIVVLQPTQNLFDAFPTKLFEYMSAGLPVIASDFPVIREIIGDNELGLLVNPQDPAAIARAMDWILDHPEDAAVMGERGREAVLNRYNWSIEAQKLVAAYAGLS